MAHVIAEDFGRVILYLDDCRCEDCDSRDALDEMGNARFHPWYGHKLTSGCAGCGGTGRAADSTVRFVFDESILRTRLTLKQRFVMERRLGTLDGRKYSQQEIASAMGVSRQAVTDHEAAAKARLEALVR